jgi:hypothetical protein
MIEERTRSIEDSSDTSRAAGNGQSVERMFGKEMRVVEARLPCKRF